MKVFIVYCHPEVHSFNHAMFSAACVTLKEAGCDVRTSDLHAMKFDPRPGRDAYKLVKDPEIFKQQIEELYATEQHAFADLIENEIHRFTDPVRYSETTRGIRRFPSEESPPQMPLLQKCAKR